MTAYDAVFGRVLTRTDPERAHHTAFRAIRAAEPALPEIRLWGIWSPRQIVDHVRSTRQSPALADLTDLVEEIYFSARLASETVLPLVMERVELAMRERTRAA